MNEVSKETVKAIFRLPFSIIAFIWVTIWFLVFVSILWVFTNDTVGEQTPDYNELWNWAKGN